MAALVDGMSDAERDAVRERLGTLSAEDAAASAAVYQRVVMNETSLEKESTRLASSQCRQLAFEMATCVCNADGATSAAEGAFLDRLQAALDIAQRDAAVRQQANELVTLEMSDRAAPAAPVATPPRPDEAAIDAMVLKSSIMNAALELLPQSLATMAIIPLQTRMVYKIGTMYGYPLDSGHIKEFIGTIGAGMTGQVLENFARKLFGGFGRLAGGWMVGGVASMATGPATTFATTYAMGQVAKQYYGGGRRLDAINLKTIFAHQFEAAKGLYQQHAGAIGTQASSMDARQVMQMVRGG
jgi:uncharacterized protein (DUF697 family)